MTSNANNRVLVQRITVYWVTIFIGIFWVCYGHCGTETTQLNGRNVVLDTNGKLLSWIDPDPSIAYPAMIQLAREFMKNDIEEEFSLPIYYCRPTFRRTPPHIGGNWYSNPADVLSGFIHSFVIDYDVVFGNSELSQQVFDFADYMIECGSTPVDPAWAWPGCPYPQDYGGVLPPRASDRGGSICPHLTGKLGRHYIWLFMKTGEVYYWEAGIRCADALANNIRTGDINHSPWPWRVLPESGSVYQSNEYCADVIDPIALLDLLIALDAPNKVMYREARTAAWTWLMSSDGPISTGNWSNYFEDCDYIEGNHCQITIGETARYLLEHQEMDPEWEHHCRLLIWQMETLFGESYWSAIAMNEQISWMYPMISHTARYASICALMYRQTGDIQFKEKAFRAFNWSTYGSCPEKPRVFVEVMDNTYGWFSDCLADYLQHLFAGMGAIPEWAPSNRNALIYSDSVIQNIQYASDHVIFSVFGNSSSELLRLQSKPYYILTENGILAEVYPSAIGSWKWQALDIGGVCEIDCFNTRKILVKMDNQPVVYTYFQSPDTPLNSGVEFWMNLIIDNRTDMPLNANCLFIAIEYNGIFYFSPDWQDDLQCHDYNIKPGITIFPVIDSMVWPDTSEIAGKTTFWALITDSNQKLSLSNLSMKLIRWE